MHRKRILKREIPSCEDEKTRDMLEGLIQSTYSNRVKISEMHDCLVDSLLLSQCASDEMKRGNMDLRGHYQVQRKFLKYVELILETTDDGVALDLLLTIRLDDVSRVQGITLSNHRTVIVQVPAGSDVCPRPPILRLRKRDVALTP